MSIYILLGALLGLLISITGAYAMFYSLQGCTGKKFTDKVKIIFLFTFLIGIIVSGFILKSYRWN